MTKILYAVICIVCLTTFIGLSNAQTVSISKVEGEAGSTVEASINLDSDVENVGSIDVTLTYDAGLLTAKELVTIVAGFTVIPNLNVPGKIIIGAFSSDGLGKTIVAGTMFNVKFEVNADVEAGSTSNLTLEEMLLSNDLGEEIAVEVENGEFTVPGVVNIPPTADAGVAELTAEVGEEIQFDGSASTDDGEITAFNWDLGDGEVGEGEQVTHAYAEAGEYTVTLTVTDDQDETDTVTVKVTVTEVEIIPPTAVIAGDAELTAKVGETIEFDGSGSTDEDGTIESYNWDFGDGSSDTEAQTSHVYEGGGEFVVTLTVTDDKGDTGTATVKVTVEVEELEPAIREHAEGSPMLALEGQFLEENISAKCYIDVWTGEFKIEAGQYLEYQIVIYSGNPSFNAGIDLHTTDDTLLSATDAADEAGLSASPNTDLSSIIQEDGQDAEYAARDRWYHRKISLDALADKTLDGIMLATESETNRVGKIRIYVDNIQITDGENRLLDVYIDDDTILDGKQEATEGQFVGCEGIEDTKVLVGVTSIGVQPAGKLPLTWGKIKAAQ